MELGSNELGRPCISPGGGPVQACFIQACFIQAALFSGSRDRSTAAGRDWGGLYFLLVVGDVV
jgi:hypothetical protein